MIGRRKIRQHKELVHKIQNEWMEEQMRLIMEDLRKEYQANKDKNK